MKNTKKILIIVYFVIVLLQILLSYNIPMSSSFSDDYQYLKMSQSFFYDLNFNVHGINSHQFPPLYPIIISLANIFKDSTLVYITIKIINAILSSLIIFPIFLLSKEFISNKKAIIISTLVAIIPSNFAKTSYIMSENLFYVLFAFSVYFLYKSIIKNRYSDNILAGIFIGLSFLTRINAIALIITSMILFLYFSIKNKKIDYKKILLIFVSFIIIFPWLLRNLLLFGFNLSSVFGVYLSESISLNSTTRAYPLIVWLINYIGFLLLSSGIIFGVFTFIKTKDKNLRKLKFLVLIITIIILFISANHHIKSSYIVYYLNSIIYFSSGPVGRYVDPLLPLIFVIGFISLQEYKRNPRLMKKKHLKLIFIIVGLLVSIASFHLILGSLFPFNNLSLSWLGSLKYVIDFLIYSITNFYPIFTIYSSIIIIIISIILVIITYLIAKKRIFMKFVIILTILLLLNSLLTIFMISYNTSNKLYKLDQIQLSLWLNEYDKDKISNILIDDRYEGSLKNYNQTNLYSGDKRYNLNTFIGFWLNDRIIIGNISELNNINYVITKDKLDLNLIKEKDGIYIYKVR